MKKQQELALKQETELAKERESFDIQGLFNKAIEAGNVEIIERLMSVRRELKLEKAKQEFTQALKGFQSEVKPVTMDCTVRNKDGSIRYRYASLKQILKEIQPLLDKWGLTISFDTIPSGQNTLTIKCILTHTSGHSETREFTIPIDTSQHMSDIQRWGSTLTYAKRYALVSTLNLIAEEDIDGIEVKNEQENKKEDIKIKKITILDDGTVIEKKEEKVKEAEVKKDKEKEEENVVDRYKKELLDKIRVVYKQLLEKGYKRETIETWMSINYNVKFENLIETNTLKLQKIYENLKLELENLNQGGK